MIIKQTNPLEVWTAGFNDEQRDAYEFDGHCAVLAGPGSGKTKVLVAKVARLLSERADGPRGVASVTYNNEAVRELRKRLAQLGHKQDRRLFIGTVHSFCLSCVVAPFGHLLRDDVPSKLAVATPGQQQKALELAVRRLKIGSTANDWSQPLQEYRRTHPFRDEKSWHEDPQLARLTEAYESILRLQGLLDFDDMVIIALDLIRNHAFVAEAIEARFPFLVVDEYQDLGSPLHSIVKVLMERTTTEIFAVGDPDQSIYGFNGANPAYLRDLADDKRVHRVNLKMNYRCAQQIIDGSQVALAPTEPRNFKSARDDTAGELIFLECREGLAQQASAVANQVIPDLNKRGVQNGQIAILYIDKFDAGVLAKALDDAGVKFAGERDQRYLRTPFTRWLEDVAGWCSSYPQVQDAPDIEDILSVWVDMKTDAGLSVDSAFLLERTQFFEALVSLCGPDTPLTDWFTRLDETLCIEECLAKRAIAPEDLAVWADIRKRCEEGQPLGDFTVDDFARCGGRPDTVTLTTLHSSKGLEYQVVIMPGLEQGRLPGYAATTRDALAEARRVFYVGMTRAKDIVYLLYSGWYENRYGRRYSNGPSRFVSELLAELGVKPELIEVT